MQTGLDIFHYFRSGGGCQCQDWYAGQQFAYFGYLQIGWTEIVAPLRYAVAFIYRNHTDSHLLQFGAEDFCIEPFGRNIEKLEIAEYAVLQCDDDFLPAHARVDGKCLDSSLFQVLYLVFHEGNQRGDDQAKSFFGKRRNLKSDGFSSSRGH